MLSHRTHLHQYYGLATAIIPVSQMRKLKQCHERDAEINWGTFVLAACSDFQRVEDGQRGGGVPGDPGPYQQRCQVDS